MLEHAMNLKPPSTRSATAGIADSNKLAELQVTDNIITNSGVLWVPGPAGMEGMMRMMGLDGANGGGGDEADDKLYISEYAGKWKNQFS